MTRSIDTIDTIVKNIEGRLNQLDGTNLADASEASIARLTRELSGLRNTLEQAVLGMEADRQTLNETVADLVKRFDEHLGVVVP